MTQKPDQNAPLSPQDLAEAHASVSNVLFDGTRLKPSTFLTSRHRLPKEPWKKPFNDAVEQLKQSEEVVHERAVLSRAAHLLVDENPTFAREVLAGKQALRDNAAQTLDGYWQNMGSNSYLR